MNNILAKQFMTAHAFNDSSLPFAGDVSPAEAWQTLQADPSAQLIDVRTQPEWAFAGLPNLTQLNKKTITLSWKFYPTFERNERFIELLEAKVPDKKTPLFFLCKTGGRSTDAAIAATEAGYTTCYNVAGGFEGDANAANQRGSINGWKSVQLPWEQA